MDSTQEQQTGTNVLVVAQQPEQTTMAVHQEQKEQEQKDPPSLQPELKIDMIDLDANDAGEILLSFESNSALMVSGPSVGRRKRRRHKYETVRSSIPESCKRPKATVKYAHLQGLLEGFIKQYFETRDHDRSNDVQIDRCDDDDDDDNFEEGTYVYSFRSNKLAVVKNEFGLQLSSLRVTRSLSLHENHDTGDEDETYHYYVVLTFMPTVGKELTEFSHWGQKLKPLLFRVFEEFANSKPCKDCGAICDTHLSHLCPSCLVTEAIMFGQPKRQCSVCLEDTHRYVQLDCNHCFHMRCLYPIKVTSTSYNMITRTTEEWRPCPLCRKTFTL